MRMKIKLMFDSTWSSIINEVARQCGLTVDQFCTRAVMLTVKQGIEFGERVEPATEKQGIETGDRIESATQEAANGIDNAAVTDAGLSTAEVQPVPDTNSAALPDTADASAVDSPAE